LTSPASSPPPPDRRWVVLLLLLLRHVALPIRARRHILPAAPLRRRRSTSVAGSSAASSSPPTWASVPSAARASHTLERLAPGVEDQRVPRGAAIASREARCSGHGSTPGVLRRLITACSISRRFVTALTLPPAPSSRWYRPLSRRNVVYWSRPIGAWGRTSRGRRAPGRPCEESCLATQSSSRCRLIDHLRAWVSTDSTWRGPLVLALGPPVRRTSLRPLQYSTAPGRP